MKTLSLSPFLLPSPQLAPSNELITAAAAANLGKPQTTTTKTNYPNYGVAGCVACERRRARAAGCRPAHRPLAGDEQTTAQHTAPPRGACVRLRTPAILGIT